VGARAVVPLWLERPKLVWRALLLSVGEYIVVVFVTVPSPVVRAPERMGGGPDGGLADLAFGQASLVPIWCPLTRGFR
jgi:hypothetical protein